MFKVPNIRHLRVFLQVVKYNSISKASEKVFLSQPAITQAITKLEAGLETCLFERRNDGMYITDSGKLFAHRVRRALDLILEGLRDALGSRNYSDKADRDSGRPQYLLASLTATQLRALVAVAEAQNFTVASRNVGISQSSLHRAARELESLLDVKLFEKTSIGISASRAALTLTKATKLAFAEIEQGGDEVGALHDRDVGRIVIGSMPLARTSILPTAIIDFLESYPDFYIDVVDGAYDDLLSHLRHGDIDLLIGALRFPLPSDDVLQEELFSSDIEVIARKGHLLADSSEVSVEELAACSWIVPRKGTPTRNIFESLFIESGVELPKRLVECSSQSLIRQLLLGSNRLTMMSAHQLQGELSIGELVTISSKLKHATRPIGITMRKNWQPTAAQLSFVQRLRSSGGVLRNVA